MCLRIRFAVRFAKLVSSKHWRGLVNFVAVASGLAWPAAAWLGLAWFGPKGRYGLDMVRGSIPRLGMVLEGNARALFGSPRRSQVVYCPVRIGLVRESKDSGTVGRGVRWKGQQRSGTVLTGRVW